MHHQNTVKTQADIPAASKQPWLEGVRGEQVLPIINLDADIIRVEAGPGTGKTFGLVRRVQRILHPNGLNVPGKDVLIVAFNRVIAKQLKEDIDECLKSFSHNGEPKIQTVHALCLEVIGGKLRILLPHEREAMVFDILCKYPALSNKYKTKKRDRAHANAEQALRDHEAKHRLDMELWQAVQQWLLRHQAQLISELPNLLLDRLKGGDFTNRTFQHVIVDEFQDLTAGEQQLFFEFSREGGKFVALGDPRQSIYAFRGNDREGLSKLEEFGAALQRNIESVSMTECQRCPSEVVKAANQLMGLYNAKPMVPGNDVQANLHVVVWKSEVAEAAGMAKAIVENIRANKENTKKQRHLIMVTRRQFGYALREQVVQLAPDLKIDLSFSESLLETWAVREAFLYFCLLVDPDAPTWRAWLGYQNSSDGKEYKPPSRNADAYLKFLQRYDDKITASAVESLAASSTKPNGNGGSKLWQRAKRFAQLKNQLQWNGEDPVALLKEVFDAAKWCRDEMADKETASLDMELILSRANEICQDIQSRESASSSTLLEKVARRLRYQIATKEPFESAEGSDLQITTLWGAKGITAEHVYVIGLCAEAMPGECLEEYPGTDDDYYEEQRRLFYVSITRPKKTLVLSRARHMGYGKALQLGLSVKKGKGYQANLEMSPFLRDIIDLLPSYQNGESWSGCVRN